MMGLGQTQYVSWATYELGLCRSLEEVRLGEYASVSYSHLSKCQSRISRGASRLRAYRVLLKLLVLFPALSFAPRQTLQLPLLRFVVFLLPLSLLSLFDFGTASLCCRCGVL